MLLCDFHVHTHFSDGRMSLSQVIDFYGVRGFDAIAITDHLCDEKTFLGSAAHFLGKSLNELSFSSYRESLMEEADRAWTKYKMIVLPGFELTINSISNHRSAHILGIGIHEYVSPDQDAVSLIKEIKNQGGLAIAAHPVDTGMKEPQTYHLWNRREELREHFDAWEVASGPKYFREVEKAKLPLIASSDLHVPSQIRSWKTLVDAEKHPQAILEAVRKQKLSFRFFKECSFGLKDLSNSQSLGKKLISIPKGFLSQAGVQSALSPLFTPTTGRICVSETASNSNRSRHYLEDLSRFLKPSISSRQS